MQKTTTFFMFVGEHFGKAEEAIHFYVSLFKDSGIVNIVRYGAGEGEPEGTVKHAVRFSQSYVRTLVAIKIAERAGANSQRRAIR